MNDRLQDSWGQDIPLSRLDGQLIKEISLEFLENKYLQKEIQSNINPEFTNKIKELIKKYKDGDTIIWHTSPNEKWSEGMGSEGYALIRNEYFICSIVIRMN